MSFSGFYDQTNEYFWGASLDNSKSFYEKNKENYVNYVKQPLHALHQTLLPVAQEIDEGICVTPARCVSRAFNDFRYSGKIHPIKNYMHLHFCASVAQEDKDTPGLYFGASYNGWNCGFFVYHATNAGMAAFREAILADVDAFVCIAKKIKKDSRIQIEGEDYKRDHYPDLPPEAKEYLNKKRFRLVAKHQPDDCYFSSSLAKEITSVWQTVAPMYHFYLSTIK